MGDLAQDRDTWLAIANNTDALVVVSRLGSGGRIKMQKPHLDQLTSLRFFAAAMIVVHHIQGRFGLPEFFPGAALGQGVSFFFVLSGFILTYVYYGEKIQYSRFMKNRFLRIYPLHIVTLFGAILFSPLATTDLQESPIALLMNLLLLQSFFGISEFAMTFNSPAWSISTELGFYLLFPILLLFIRRAIVIFSTIIMALFLFGYLMIYLGMEAEQYFWSFMHTHPLGRLPEFVAGIIAGRVFLQHRDSLNELGVEKRRLIANALEIGLLLACIWLILNLRELVQPLLQIAGLDFVVYFLRSGLFPLFMVLIIIYAAGSGIVSKLLSHRILVFLGEISFALYLVHQIVIRAFVFNPDLSAALNPYQTLGVILLLSLSLSAVAYLWVENPARLLARADLSRVISTFKNGSRGALTYGSATILVAGFLAVSNLHGYHEPEDEWLDSFYASHSTGGATFRNSEIILEGVTRRPINGGICLQFLWSAPINAETRGTQTFLRIANEQGDFRNVAPVRSIISTRARETDTDVFIRSEKCVKSRDLRWAGDRGEFRLLVKPPGRGMLVFDSGLRDPVHYVSLPIRQTNGPVIAP